VERVRPEGATYFIKAETFDGWKEDYVFTTKKGRGTGYFWDGMDSVKKLGGGSVEVMLLVSVGIRVISNDGRKRRSRKRKSQRQILYLLPPQ